MTSIRERGWTGSASDRPALREVQDPERDGHVALVDGVLRVTDWRTATPEVVRFFEERLAVDGGEDLVHVLDSAVRVGVIALSTAGVSANVDYVEKEFTRLSGQLQSALQDRLTQMDRAFEAVFADDDGALTSALQRYLGDGGHLAELFDPNRRDSAVSRLREVLADHFDGESSTLHRLLDVTNAASPLAGWREQIEGGFERLRRQLDDYRKEVAEQAAADQAARQARADEREKGTAKGRDFEEQVSAAVGTIAAVFGDGAEPTGDASGAVGDRRTGDVVVTLNARDTRGATVRLVFEAKDGPVGLKRILGELDGACENRGAAAAVAVYSRDEHMPTGTAPFREQGAGRYLALLDKETDDPLCLQLAYRVARYWAVAGLTADDGEVDVGGIRDDLERARGMLQDLSTAKAALTRLRTSVEESVTGVQAQLDGVRGDLADLLERVDSRIRLTTSAGS